jgi:hypothetical protein
MERGLFSFGPDSQPWSARLLDKLPIPTKHFLQLALCKALRQAHSSLSPLLPSGMFNRSMVVDISDIFFVHERGFRISFMSFTLIAGSALFASPDSRLTSGRL